MAALLKDALKPNLVQTLEHTPAFIHGGPFANIAHGCNSVIATKLALKLGDYVVTEAGFGADLGAEKFFDIKCRTSGLKPNAVVIVATIRALKMHGGKAKTELNTEDLEALEKGLPNLLRHVSNINNFYKLPCVVAVNKFPSDTQKELDLIIKKVKELGINVVLSKVWENGGKGGVDLANEVVKLCEEKNDFSFAYDLNESVEDKIKDIAKKIYGAKHVDLSPTAKKSIQKINELGLSALPICMAKTQYSFSDNPLLLGAPTDFILNVKDVKLSNGAGFIVVYTGDILTMPGLPKKPAAENIDLNEDGLISGLF